MQLPRTINMCFLQGLPFEGLHGNGGTAEVRNLAFEQPLHQDDPDRVFCHVPERTGRGVGHAPWLDPEQGSLNMHIIVVISLIAKNQKGLLKLVKLACQSWGALSHWNCHATQRHPTLTRIS